MIYLVYGVSNLAKEWKILKKKLTRNDMELGPDLPMSIDKSRFGKNLTHTI